MPCAGLAGSVCVLFVRPETILCACLAGSVCVCTIFQARDHALCVSSW